MLCARKKKMANNQTAFRAVGLVCASIVAPLWFSPVADAQSPASFKAFEGTWTGTGTLSHQNGVTERIRCRVQYVPRGAQSLQQTLQCQSDDTNFNIVSTVLNQGGRLTGDWTETTRQARGTLTGTMSSSELKAQVQGTGFTAGIGIGVRGNRQSVNIRAAGTDLSSLSMSLTRSPR
jgi:hypothetical protein